MDVNSLRIEILIISGTYQKHVGNSKILQIGFYIRIQHQTLKTKTPYINPLPWQQFSMRHQRSAYFFKKNNKLYELRCKSATLMTKAVVKI